MTTPSDQAEGRAAIGSAVQRSIGNAVSSLTGPSGLLQGVDRFMTSDGELFKTTEGRQFYVQR